MIKYALKLKKLNDMPNKIPEELKDRYKTIKQELHEEIKKHH